MGKKIELKDSKDEEQRLTKKEWKAWGNRRMLLAYEIIFGVGFLLMAVVIAHGMETSMTLKDLIASLLGFLILGFCTLYFKLMRMEVRE